MNSTLRLIRGSRIVLTIPMNSSADDIKYAARAKIAAHYRHFSPDTEVMEYNYINRKPGFRRSGGLKTSNSDWLR